jgi:hypothetical protein
MPQQNTNPARLEWITYRPSCGYEHLADPDMRVCPMVCPDGVEPDHNDGSQRGGDV